jgi:hypothetical protein
MSECVAKATMASDAVRDSRGPTEVQQLHGEALPTTASDPATTQSSTVDYIEPGDRIWCPVDVDLADSPPPAEVDFWDHLTNTPASAPTTASGRMNGTTDSQVNITTNRYYRSGPEDV